MKVVNQKLFQDLSAKIGILNIHMITNIHPQSIQIQAYTQTFVEILVKKEKIFGAIRLTKKSDGNIVVN